MRCIRSSGRRGSASRSTSAFLAEILEDPTVEVESPGGGVWGVRGQRQRCWPAASGGPSGSAPPQIAKALLEQRTVQVTDETRRRPARRQPGRDRRRPGEGQRAARALRGVVLGGPRPRRSGSSREYNRRFNAIVLRDYTTEGERLSLPGLARTFEPMPAPARRRRADDQPSPPSGSFTRSAPARPPR